MAGKGEKNSAVTCHCQPGYLIDDQRCDYVHHPAVVRLNQGYDWIDVLISAVTLAVAALPEEFSSIHGLF